MRPPAEADDEADSAAAAAREELHEALPPIKHDCLAVIDVDAKGALRFEAPRVGLGGAEAAPCRGGAAADDPAGDRRGLR